MIRFLLVGGVAYAIAVGLPLGIATAVALLARFRARVARSMRETTRKESSLPSTEESTASSAPTLPAEAFKGKLVVTLALPEEVLSSVPAAWHSAAKRPAWRLALVYAVAASVLALILVITQRFAFPSNPPERVVLFYFLYFASLFWVFATPVAFATTYVIRKQVRYLVLTALGLLGMVILWDIFIYHGTLFVFWLWVNAAPIPVALLLATRRLRAVGPVVIVGTAVWTAISVTFIGAGALYGADMLGLHFVRPDLQELSFVDATQKFVIELGPPDKVLSGVEDLFRSGRGRIFTWEHPERENAVSWWIFASVVIAFIAGALAAWACVSWLALRYRRRGASDQMLAIDVMVLLFPLTISIIFLISIDLSNVTFPFSLWEHGKDSSGSGSNAAAILTSMSIAAFVAYRLVAAAGFRYLRKARPPEPPRALLMLRVFGFARRSQRLLDDLGQRWRYLGPINLIAGADLAYAVIEPHEFYDFLSGRLSRAFVKDQEDLESRLPAGTPVADPDGLFRIQDFYCHDDTWRMTVARLARGADAVFMDLRGFTASNYGCIYEIKLLVHLVPMDRVVLLIDKTTDMPLLERTLATTWQEIAFDSPNVTLEGTRVRILQASRKHWRTLNALIAMLYIPSAGAVGLDKSPPLPCPGGFCSSAPGHPSLLRDLP